MSLWDQVSETNPAFTKKVEYGKRKFTALDAYHQIMRATELWGPAGVGWGWDATFEVIGDLCIAKLDIWHSGDRGNAFTTVGSAKVGNDGEAPKKALTDGITKGLSYLGFNADVFLGKFDDNKYVSEMRAKHGDKGSKPASQGDDSDPLTPEEIKTLTDECDAHKYTADSRKALCIWVSNQAGGPEQTTIDKLTIGAARIMRDHLKGLK